MGLLDHVVGVSLIFFLGISILFSVMAIYQFTPPPTGHTGSLFSISLPTLVISCLFDNNHSNRCKVISHGGFDLHGPDDE